MNRLHAYRFLSLAALIVVLLLVVGAVAAVDVTVPTGGSPLNVNPGTITFDTALTADVGDDLSFTFTVNSGVLGTPFYTGVNLDHGLGETAAGLENVFGSSLDLANGVANGGIAPRTGARASWSDRYLVNLPGDDLVVTENGNAGGNEYYVIRVKPVGAAESNFYYSPADAFQDSNTTDDGGVGILNDVGDFLTAFDLSDLGYADCTPFEYVEFFEMLTSDRFDSSGFGFVGAGSTLPFRPPVLDQIPVAIQSQFYDADIGFIFAANSANLETIVPKFELTTTDTTSGIVFDDVCTQVAEGTTVGDQFAFRLTSAPASNVTVTFTVSDGAQIVIDNGSVGGLSFGTTFDVTYTPATFAEWTIVNVQALFDGIDEADPHIEVVTISASSGDPVFDELTTAEAVLIYEPGVLFTTPNPALVQEGAGGTYTAVLTAPPGLSNDTTGETVTVDPRNINTRFIASLSPDPFSFVRSNWNVPQTLTFTTVDDGRDYGVQFPVSINHPTSSNVTSPYDSRYGGTGSNISTPRQRITIVDNDQVDGTPMTDAQYEALRLASWLDLAAGAPVVEGTSSAALSIRLAGQPAPGERVVIDLASVAGVTLAPAQVVFNEFNWNSYQTINMTVAAGAAAQGSYAVPVQAMVAAGTTMPDVIGAADAVQVTIVDAAGAPAELPLQQQFDPATEASSSAEGSQSE